MLVLAGMAGNLYAQSGYPMYYYSVANGKTKTDNVFTIAFTGMIRHRITIMMEKGNSITVNVAGRQDFERIINIDSILSKAWDNLKQLKDSLDDELTNKTIDYVTDLQGNIKIRFQQYQPKGSSYTVLNGELTPMKIEQDSLNIIGYFPNDHPYEPSRPNALLPVIPYKITVAMNDINNLKSLINGKANEIMAQALDEWYKQKNWSPKRGLGKNMLGYYNLADPSKTSKLHEAYNYSSGGRNYYVPYAQISIQGVNNRFVTSAGLGFEIIHSRGHEEQHAKLYWEPYFGFSTDQNGKTKLRRNDFVTFQYTEAFYEDNTKKKIQYAQIFSLGYLVHRSGNLFEKNTFKFGLPGIQYKDLFLYPECYFHDLFKQFQPTLKLMLYLD